MAVEHSRTGNARMFIFSSNVNYSFSLFWQRETKDRAPSDDVRNRSRLWQEHIKADTSSRRSVREACAVSETKYHADFVPQNKGAWQRYNAAPTAQGSSQRTFSTRSEQPMFKR
jgi:hypothetical protein